MILLELYYLLSAVLFIVGIRSLGSPATARRGMQLAAIGMLVAIIGTLLNHHMVTYRWIIGGIVLGTVLSIPISWRIPMTKIPQRIALSHACGALAACLIGIAEYLRYQLTLGHLSMAITGSEVMLGALTFTGSLMVAGKLHGILPGYPITYRGQNQINIAFFLVLIGLLCYLIGHPAERTLFYLLLGLTLVFGLFVTTPIGAADMPVLIALFNAYGGLTAAAMGFMLGNRIQIITGALDGTSGLILAILMCKAMNRSITHVLLGAFGARSDDTAKSAGHVSNQAVQEITIEDTLFSLENAQRVIIAPGYGMAAAQAHHALRALADKLKANGVSVKYAIHPVAGRMPGHMNVLLAEANVTYTDLFDLDDINPEFAQADLALVVGANDVTNPAARTIKSSPIYGMPILALDQAKKVIVLKRSLSTGFSGVDNALYHQQNTWMLFGDAKDSLNKLAYAFKKGWS